MKTLAKSRLLRIIPPLLLYLLTLSRFTTPVAAASTWQLGGVYNTTTVTYTYVSMNVPPTAPYHGCYCLLTLWSGETSDTGYSTQLELRQVIGLTTWFFEWEGFDNQGNKIDYGSDVFFNPDSGDHVQFSLQVLGGNQIQVCMDESDGTIEKSECHTFAGGKNWGTSFSTEYAVVESADFSGSDFHGWQAVHFTGALYKIGRAFHTPTFSKQTYGSPPSCFADTYGSGYVTVDPSNC